MSVCVSDVERREREKETREREMETLPWGGLFILNVGVVCSYSMILWYIEASSLVTRP